MATAKTKTAKTVETIETPVAKAAVIARKGARAYLGLFGMAYDRAQMRAEQVRTATDGLFDTLVAKGEIIEGKAVVFAKDAQAKATTRYVDTSAKVRSVLPTSANDRVSELEAKITALNKKIAALSKKAVKPAKKASMKTAKTKKAA